MQQVRGGIKYNEPMSRHSSWRVGGPAKTFFQPRDLDDLAVFLKSQTQGEAILWVGLGSNLLVRDGGFDGVVISLVGMLNDIYLTDEQTLYVESGLPCPKVARFASQQQLSGMEFLAGIPGTVGGALAMNAGAFGSETWDIVHSVRTINHLGAIHNRYPEEYELAYRSVKGVAQEWFVSCELVLNMDMDQTSLEKIRALLQLRNETQPIGQPSCGSVFKNPMNDYAARLIEQTGLKGFSIGDAVVSEKHANFIINEGNASAEDLELLIQHIHKEVLMQQGIALETEVRIVGNRINEYNHTHTHKSSDQDA